MGQPAEDVEAPRMVHLELARKAEDRIAFSAFGGDAPAGHDDALVMVRHGEVFEIMGDRLPAPVVRVRVNDRRHFPTNRFHA